AYSTISQLGYMVMAVGLTSNEAAMFHLFTHALFKALLFLAAGCIIVSLHHEQNIWKMGGLAQKLKITFATFAVGALALIACPASILPSRTLRSACRPTAGTSASPLSSLRSLQYWRRRSQRCQRWHMLFSFAVAIISRRQSSDLRFFVRIGDRCAHLLHHFPL